MALGYPPRQFETIVHARVHAGTDGTQKLDIYFERAWELSLVSSNKLAFEDLLGTEEKLFATQGIPGHTGTRKLLTASGLEMMQHTRGMSSLAAGRVPIQAHWHVSQFSGKVLQWSLDLTTLTAELDEGMLEADELEWLYDTRLPEVILAGLAGSPGELKEIATCFGRVIPTDIVFPNCSKGFEASDKTPLGEVRRLAWELHPYAFEAKFPLLLFSGSKFALQQVGQGNLCCRSVLRKFEEVQNQVGKELKF